MIRSLQIIDTLRIGGAERMAINIANGLSNKNVESHICATRSEGQLKASLISNVSYLFLNKKSATDVNALIRLKNYIKENEINVIHAHGTSFFLAVLVKFFVWDLKLIWHDHYGNRVNDTNKFKLILLKLCSFKFSIVYCVNHELKDWANTNLHCKIVKFISNYPTINTKNETILNGKDGNRILCAANLKSPKNHELLFSAFKELIEEFNDWSLHCIGSIYNDDYSDNLKNYIADNKLEKHIFMYGAKEDVSFIISQSNIGVLSSSSEGLPMALLEYGLGELAVITTNVGYCSKLIVNDTYGILVPNRDKDALRDGLRLYLSDLNYRNLCAENFNNKIIKEFSESIVLDKLVKDYKSIIISKKE